MTFDELLERYEPRLAAAFRECIDAIRSTVVLKTVVERLERGDVAGAVRAIQIEPQAFAALELALQEAFNAGGVNMVQSLPQLVAPDGTRVLFQFGVRNLMAETMLRNHSSTLVTNIVEDQREALRMAFEAGLSRGQNPTRTALDVVGRVSRVTGRREGGV
ncbi:MAG TPA: head morphogenesis protein, partial [Pseudorhizobium sp.]|nr:head morphogenesis protein [Pseudorhizobium sp.]